MINISRKPSHLFAATVLGAVLCAGIAPAHAGLLGGGASGGLTANGRVGGQLGADSRGLSAAPRTISNGAERAAGGLGAQGAAQGSVPGGTQGSAAGAVGGNSTSGLSGSAISAPTSSAADASLHKEPGTVQGGAAARAGRTVDASGDATLKTPTRTQR